MCSLDNRLDLNKRNLTPTYKQRKSQKMSLSGDILISKIPATLMDHYYKLHVIDEKISPNLRVHTQISSNFK